MELRGTLASAALAFAMSVCAQPMLPTDSVDFRALSPEDGAGGMRLEWSRNGLDWHSIADGMTFISSDFGAWGSGKKMFDPQLRITPQGVWEVLFKATPNGTVYALATSPDLKNWTAQRYADSPAKLGWPGDTRAARAPYSVVESLEQYAAWRNRRWAENSEKAADDPVRFRNLKPLTATVTLRPEDSKEISDKLIGIFFEDINYAADGGLYAELVQNRDFEYSAADRGDWGPAFAWTYETNGTPAELEIATSDPIHVNNPHYARLNAASTLTNNGFDGISLKPGKYFFSMFGRAPKGAKATVELLDGDGTVLASRSVNISSKTWKKSETVLNVARACPSASIRLSVSGAADVDMISLFPADTFKGRRNGLRKDLAQTLADLRPQFVRFPGGCVAHGNGVDNIYDWKGSVGALEARRPLSNLWGYHQTRGLGFHEYFQFCEDIGAEPLPVLAAGVPCQNSSREAHHTHDDVTHYGQQCGIPMEEMDSYIQDVLDLVEYANGDARTTEYGRMRARNGHPKPFNLKYLGIGNEDMITEVFEERFRMIYKAVKDKYPEIEVVGTAGPFYEGTDYREGWRLASELKVPLVDEHYYVDPGWMINNQDFYDNYDRNGSKVYLGEYAAHLPGRPSNVETALAEALYLTSVERNGDVVAMTSYAPLLAKDNHTQWRPDLIYFGNNDIRPTVDYYVQQLYGNNAGTTYIPSDIEVDTSDRAARRRIGFSAVTDPETGDLILKLVNMLPVAVDVTVAVPAEYASKTSATRTVLSGAPADDNVRPEVSKMTAGGESLPVKLTPYSFTVIRLSEGK